ncbi:MAG: hypothetical protein AB4426_09010 [Xenococcaceae cyanobacterium]
MMTTTSDIEIREFINNGFEQLDKKLTEQYNTLDKRIDALDKKFDVYIAKTDERLKGIESRLETFQSFLNKIPDQAERVGELKNWRQIALIVISATVAATFGWFLRGGKP